jgi:hypothetical protein
MVGRVGTYWLLQMGVENTVGATENAGDVAAAVESGNCGGRVRRIPAEVLEDMGLIVS